MRALDKGLAEAVAYFWSVQGRQNASQGTASGRRDAGRRAAVTGGGHCTGFADLMCKLPSESGIPDAEVFFRRAKPEIGEPPRDSRLTKTVLPGYFRPAKNWDLLVVCGGELLGVIEFKSQIGSLGNNAHNRAEEAVGNGYDFQSAYRKGAFRPSAPPWLGYFMLLEDTPAAFEPVKTPEPHFKVFPEFKDASYCKRYELLCERLVRDRLYDAACLILSNAKTGVRGTFREPEPEFSFRNFAMSLTARAQAFAKMRKT